MLEVTTLPKPQGPRVLVKVIPTEEVSEGGIVMVASIKDKRREEQAQMIGEVMAIGHTCWHEPVGDGVPWAKVGDKVLFAKFSGPEFKLKGEDALYRIMNDEDLIAVLEAAGTTTEIDDKTLYSV